MKFIALKSASALLLLAGSWYAYRRHKQKADNDTQATTKTWTELKLHATQPPAQPTSVSPAELDAARDSFLRVCATNQPHLAAKALLAWAKLVWPQHPPVSLHELATKAQAETEIFELHQRLYQYSEGDESWTGTALARALQHGLKPKAANPGSTRGMAQATIR